MKTQFSQIWAARSKAVIAHGSLTNSKRPECFIEGVYPTHIERAHGAFVWDVDGNRYTDFICSLGAILVGHANHRIGEAVKEQLAKGTVYSLGSRLEVEFAEKITSMFSHCEKIRVLKTGSEACSAAVRIARAHTGRVMVLSEGYHGWHDQFVGLTPPAKGVPSLELRPTIGRFNWQSGPAETTAAVIVEPVINDYSENRLLLLRELRRRCDETGALLIFDETITGCRFPGFSFAKWSGIEPHISIFGKAMGGGFPLAVVGGRTAVMNSDYFVSSTFAGDCIAMRASLELIRILSEDETLARMWSDAENFKNNFNKIAPELIAIEGYPTRGIFVSPNELTKALFMQECAKAGILVGPSWFWNLPIAEERNELLALFRVILTKINGRTTALEGKMPVKPYAQSVRQ